MKISIVIPVLNDADRLGVLLDALEGGREVVVADGGSRDDPAARAAGRARMVTSAPGRARQMNAGAAACGGDVLLFLHSDTRLPPGAFERIGEAMRDPGVAGGGFRHRFDGGGLFGRFISLSANARARGWGLFFGDQAIFVRREAFERLGGYGDLPLFEDWDLCRRMRRQGRMAFIPEPVTTSARRIEVWGKWRCFCVWWGLGILYALGVPADSLARHYADVR
ncbi:MAG: TIGR04283 family arsenosugar biosynthesis glycosyltransferase [bacterium]